MKVPLSRLPTLPPPPQKKTPKKLKIINSKLVCVDFVVTYYRCTAVHYKSIKCIGRFGTVLLSLAT